MLPSIFTLGVVALSTVRVVEAQDSTPDRTSAAGEASIKIDLTPFPPSSLNLDPDQECEAYRYQPVADALASFPSIWQQASLLPGDDNAAAKWAAIQPNVPDIAPKGTPQGDFSGMSYGSDDPDCWWTVSKCTNPKVQNVPADVTVMPEPRTLGYGFDDGPNCSHNAFYDYLAQQNQKATMFFIGSNVMDWPLEAARAAMKSAFVNSWSHNYMTALQSEDAFAELYYSATPTCWRPPFGDVDDRIRAIANGLGLRTVLWQYDSQDWQVGVTEGVTSDSVDQEYQNMIDDAKKGMFDTVGTMILMHELNDFTMQEAIKYYPKLKEAFDHIVPVAVGLNITHPYVETNFTMPSFAQYIAGTGATLAANTTSSAGSTTASSTGSSGTASGGVAVESTKTGDASRASGSAGVQMVAALVLGVACAAVVGLLPS
ncbi:hypothetical protein NLJ89_g3430 [Agrocybe chaxingu]|uniref:chitin deacetylase n=1 Tax=Agrocybe chaxingu TaxID=84603 RepID=A0A9W8K9X7_9AGAR|nr:hypothetical protein NLJ89_g3430 [Agrocybe chaxingu]